MQRSRRIGTLAVIGLLALALWPSTGSAQAPAAVQDTLQALLKKGELTVGTFNFRVWGSSSGSIGPSGSGKSTLLLP